MAVAVKAGRSLGSSAACRLVGQRGRESAAVAAAGGSERADDSSLPWGPRRVPATLNYSRLVLVPVLPVPVLLPPLRPLLAVKSFTQSFSYISGREREPLCRHRHPVDFPRRAGRYDDYIIAPLTPLGLFFPGICLSRLRPPPRPLDPLSACPDKSFSARAATTTAPLSLDDSSASSRLGPASSRL